MTSFASGEPAPCLDPVVTNINATVQANLSPERFNAFLQKPASLVETAFNVFGFMPPDDDMRWPFLATYDVVMGDFPFRGMNFDNAWGAVYLSEEPSWRSGYISTINPENTTQLNRALFNLAHRRDVKERFEASESPDDPDIKLRLTDALISHPGQEQPPETPCPEALYQLRLYEDGYLGRVGFNIHNEAGVAAMSIVNVQGVPGSPDRNRDFEEEHGVSPFNYLVDRAKRLAAAGDHVYDIRGIVNPKRGNSRLYHGVFEAEAVPTFKAHHKPSYTPPSSI